MKRHLRTRRGRVGRLIALVATCAIVLTGCEFSVYKMPLPGGADLGEDPYSVKIAFQDVLDLVPQSAVKVNDVSVGRVDEIEVKGYTAEVTVLVNDDAELPDNAVAKIRQTSLLGEKFVSLEVPPGGGSGNPLEDGDFIPLDRSGNNPEVEEVLGAMSLLLNGGGIGQLKTITVELNKALEGRESDVKSVLNQLDLFTGQLDKGKSDILDAIESVNQLAISLNEEEKSIKLALDELPAGLASIDRQRDDLIKMLDALNELSNVAVRVIRQSKAGTIDSLQLLDPILTKLAEAGDAFPKALQVFLTYPFIDEVVGRNPVQARNLHMGDYTNLSVQIDLLDLSAFEIGGTPVCELVGGELANVVQQLRDAGLTQPEIDAVLDQILQLPLDACEAALDELEDVDLIDDLCEILGGIPGLPTLPIVCEPTTTPTPTPTLPVPTDVLTDLEKCLQTTDPQSPACEEFDLPRLVEECEKPENRDEPLCKALPGLDLGIGGNGGGVTGGLAGPLNRPVPGPTTGPPSPSEPESTPERDAELGAMLVWGMMAR